MSEFKKVSNVLLELNGIYFLRKFYETAIIAMAVFS